MIQPFSKSKWRTYDWQLNFQEHHPKVFGLITFELDCKKGES